MHAHNTEASRSVRSPPRVGLGPMDGVGLNAAYADAVLDAELDPSVGGDVAQTQRAT